MKIGFEPIFLLFLNQLLQKPKFLMPMVNFDPPFHYPSYTYEWTADESVTAQEQELCLRDQNWHSGSDPASITVYSQI